MVDYGFMPKEELVEELIKVIQRKELHIQQLEFVAKEALEILEENNWRGDLQDDINVILGG